jgi:hypothetical protein
MPDTESPFSRSALPVNHSGGLSEEQSQRWRRIAKGRRQSVRGVAYVFAAIGAFLLFANGPATKAVARFNGGLAFLGIAAILVVGASLESVNADVREGRVESVEGAIAKSFRAGLRAPGGRLYLLHVAGRRLQALSRASYDAAPDAGYVRIYFFPRSKLVVNLEQLEDPSIPTGSGAAQEIVQNFARALLTRDRTTIAEASARVAALKHVIEGPPPTSPDGSARSLSPLRAEDVYGTWTNPMMTISFMKNGTASLTMAFGGTRRDGHWSIDTNGKLLTDARGNPEPLDVSLNGNQLTITIEGQRMAFTRIA